MAALQVGHWWRSMVAVCLHARWPAAKLYCLADNPLPAATASPGTLNSRGTHPACQQTSRIASAGLSRPWLCPSRTAPSEGGCCGLACCAAARSAASCRGMRSLSCAGVPAPQLVDGKRSMPGPQTRGAACSRTPVCHQSSAAAPAADCLASGAPADNIIVIIE